MKVFALQDVQCGVKLKDEDIKQAAQAAVENALNATAEWHRIRTQSLQALLLKTFQVLIVYQNPSLPAYVLDQALETCGMTLYEARDYDDALRWILENRKPHHESKG